MIEVVAALIWKDDTFMICRRPAHKGCPLLWEFAGGKVEAGETKEEALIRECREELAVRVSVKEPFMEVTYDYPDATVHLTVFTAEIEEGQVQLLEHCDLRYITPEEIPDFAFCPADESILARIRENAHVRKQAEIRPGRYRHFKGNEYEVICIARHSETLEDMVVYRALYGNGDVWVRPASMWNEIIERNGQTFRRFTYINQ